MLWFAIACAIAMTPVVKQKNAPGSPRTAPSFTTGIVPLLTKPGCNPGRATGRARARTASGCRFAASPRSRITSGSPASSAGRRLDPPAPKRACSFARPPARTPHEGGRLFAPGSREYDLLLDWLKAGYPGPEKAEPKISKLELTPAHVHVKPGEAAQLRRHRDLRGRHEARCDLADQVRFERPGYLAVSPAGKAKALGTARASCGPRSRRRSRSRSSAMPFDRAVDEERFAGHNNFVDDHVFAKLAALRIEPSDLCTDAEFLRRPTSTRSACCPRPTRSRRSSPTRMRTSARSSSTPCSRGRSSPTTGHCNWATCFQNRQERDHDVRGTKGVRQFHAWLRKQVADNRPWDKIARDVLTATGSNTDNPAVGYYVVTVGEQRHARTRRRRTPSRRRSSARASAARVPQPPAGTLHAGRLLSLRRLLLPRQARAARTPKTGPTVLRVSHPDQNQNKKPGRRQPAAHRAVHEAAAAGPHRRATSSRATTRASTLANWITDPKNEYFAGAMVNRVWRHYLGVGLVEPVDDLRASNPPTNPELWKALDAEFVEKKFDLRHLMRLILNSRHLPAVGRDAAGQRDRRAVLLALLRPPPAGRGAARRDLRRDRRARQFHGYPLGVRAVQVPDPGASRTSCAVRPHAIASPRAPASAPAT